MADVNQSSHQSKSPLTSKKGFSEVTVRGEQSQAKQDLAVSESMNTSDGKINKKAGKAFPNILMEILSNEGWVESIQWCPGGEAFEILNPTAFSNDILPMYFKNSKYNSFVRKLYRWGFRMKSVQCKNVFYHTKFLRDRKELIPQMKLQYSPKELRVKRTKKSIRKSSIIQMLETDQSSCESRIEGSASARSIVQRPNVTFTCPNPQSHSVSNGIVHYMPLQSTQTNLISVPSFPVLYPTQFVPLPSSSNQSYSSNPVVPSFSMLNNISMNVVSDFQAETKIGSTKR